MKIELTQPYKIVSSAKQVFVSGNKIISLIIQNKTKKRILHP
jgi:hypothetical protein